MESLQYDQHFLIDPAVRDQLISCARLTSKDVVLEIGAGTGFITQELARHCAKVIAVEMDLRFKPDLASLPANVEVLFGNALDIIGRINYSKVVANPPFAICEPLLKALLKKNPKRISLLVSAHFYSLFYSESKWALIAPLFYTISKVMDVPKNAYEPLPRVSTVIMLFVRRTANLTTFEKIIKEMVLQDDKKVKNALANAFRTVLCISKLQATNLSKSMLVPPVIGLKRVDHLSNRQFKSMHQKISLFK